MKTVKNALKAVGFVGLFAAVVLADSLQPSRSELISSIVILVMSATMLLSAMKIDEVINAKK